MATTRTLIGTILQAGSRVQARPIGQPATTLRDEGEARNWFLAFCGSRPTSGRETRGTGAPRPVFEGTLATGGIIQVYQVVWTNDPSPPLPDLFEPTSIEAFFDFRSDNGTTYTSPTATNITPPAALGELVASARGIGKRPADPTADPYVWMRNLSGDSSSLPTSEAVGLRFTAGTHRWLEWMNSAIPSLPLPLSAFIVCDRINNAQPPMIMLCDARPGEETTLTLRYAASVVSVGAAAAQINRADVSGARAVRGGVYTTDPGNALVIVRNAATAGTYVPGGSLVWVPQIGGTAALPYIGSVTGLVVYDRALSSADALLASASIISALT